MSKKPKRAPPSGCEATTTPASCPPHHWRLGTTEHVHIPGEGLSNIGQTQGVCIDCGVTSDWEAPTPDNVHGMDSHILAEMANTKEGSEYGSDT